METENQIRSICVKQLIVFNFKTIELSSKFVIRSFACLFIYIYIYIHIGMYGGNWFWDSKRATAQATRQAHTRTIGLT